MRSKIAHTGVVSLNPTIASGAKDKKNVLASRPTTLDNKVVGCLWNLKPTGDRILQGVVDVLSEKYRLGGVRHFRKRRTEERADDEILEEIKRTCDVTLIAIGD